MSAFNTVIVPWEVPGPMKKVDLRIQFKYGDVWQYEYRIGDSLKWGGNDVGTKPVRSVVVHGYREPQPEVSHTPVDFDVYIVANRIEQVVPTSSVDRFLRVGADFIVLEP